MDTESQVHPTVPCMAPSAIACCRLWCHQCSWNDLDFFLSAGTSDAGAGRLLPTTPQLAASESSKDDGSGFDDSPPVEGIVLFAAVVIVSFVAELSDCFSSVVFVCHVGVHEWLTFLICLALEFF